MQKVVGSNPISRSASIASLDWVRRLALVLALIPVVAAGCGGGSTETTTRAGPQLHGGPLAKADFIDLADAICRNHQSRREDLESQATDLGRLNSEGKAHAIAALLRQESSNRKAEVQELEALQPPSGDVTRVGSILSLVRAETTLIDKWAEAYDDLDAEAIRRQQIRLGLTSAKAAARARAYGFEVCGQQ